MKDNCESLFLQKIIDIFDFDYIHTINLLFITYGEITPDWKRILFPILEHFLILAIKPTIDATSDKTTSYRSPGFLSSAL